MAYKKDFKYEFNPIKDLKGNEQAQQVIWSTKSLNAAVNAIKQGLPLKANPFIGNNTKLLKPELVFKRTDEEVEDYIRCMNDVIYFASKCYIIQPTGLEACVLRDYQIDYLKHLQENRFSILLAARQIGKCLNMLNFIRIKLKNNKFDKKLEKIISFYIKKDNLYEIPFFELYNLFCKQTWLWKCKYQLYKIIYKLEHTKKKVNEICYTLISLLDKIDFKYYHNKLLDNYKTIDDIDIKEYGIEILSDTGFHPLTNLMITKPFDQYIIKLENGYELNCADEHKVYDKYYNEIYVEDLKVGDEIITDAGSKKIISILHKDQKICMCDTTVDHPDHRFYSNGILSHNSVITAIYCLWKILFSIDKSGLILSKSAAAGVDLLKKIKDMFLNLPYYLKPGIYKWNQHEISFDNNSNIATEAFSPTAGLGKTINFLILDEFAWCPNNEVELFYMNILPTITTMPDSNVCIMSTQNGFNFFYTLWKGANEVGKEWNGYSPFKVDWWQVPQYNNETHQWEKRTQAWKDKMVGILGGEANFYYQYGTTFSASDKCIVNRTKLGEMHDKEIKFINIPMIIDYWKKEHNIDFEFNMHVLHPEFLFFDPNYDFSRLTQGFFLVLCDLAEGGGNDYTTFNILEMIDKDKFVQIGYWHSNTVDLENAATEFWLTMGQLFMNNQNVIYSIEWNTYGQLFFNYLMSLNEPEYNKAYSWRFNIFQEFDLNSIIRYTVRFEVTEDGVKMKKVKRVPGIRFNGQNKVTACSLLKLMLENGSIDIYDYFTISEIENFEDKNGNGSYEASYGHDDIVMTLAQIPMLQQTPKYKQLCEDFDEQKNANKQQLFMPHNSLYGF